MPSAGRPTALRIWTADRQLDIRTGLWGVYAWGSSAGVPVKSQLTAIRFVTVLLIAASFGCSAAPKAPLTGEPLDKAPSAAMHERVRALGPGLQFRNHAVSESAVTPTDGAQYVYDRSFSANSRMSAVGIELWLFDASGAPVHTEHSDSLTSIYRDIYGWNASEWRDQLGQHAETTTILETKSDMFWESLAQQFAERIFGLELTPAIYRYGPECADPEGASCDTSSIDDATTVVVRTFLDARRDPMNPVTRSITYTAHRDRMNHPELMLELHVPNGVRVAGPEQEVLDFRPSIVDRQEPIKHLQLWAHLPPDRRSRTVNADYPDYNLLFIPLRHLALQGSVDTPKERGSSIRYSTTEDLIQYVGSLLGELRTAEGGRAVAERLRPFLTAKYYYMFDAGGQGMDGYRSYILGSRSGIGRGLNPDFGRIELLIDGSLVATYE